MLEFITDNLGTILISAAIAAAVVAIVINMVRKRRKGKPIGCDCGGCGGCPGADICHVPGGGKQ